MDETSSQMTDSVFEAGGSVHTKGSNRSSSASVGSSISFESAADRGPHIRFLLGVLKVRDTSNHRRTSRSNFTI